jgi:hypothetical protein
MSKGIGGLQRALLAALQEHGCLNTLDAARHAYKIEPCDTVDGVPQYYIDDAQHAATRRALAGLVKRGLIVKPGGRGRAQLPDGRWVGRARWCTPQYAVHHHHCSHHSEPPLDPTHALSFWD